MRVRNVAMRKLEQLNLIGDGAVEYLNSDILVWILALPKGG